MKLKTEIERAEFIRNTRLRMEYRHLDRFGFQCIVNAEGVSKCEDPTLFRGFYPDEIVAAIDKDPLCLGFSTSTGEAHLSLAGLDLANKEQRQMAKDCAELVYGLPVSTNPGVAELVEQSHINHSLEFLPRLRLAQPLLEPPETELEGDYFLSSRSDCNVCFTFGDNPQGGDARYGTDSLLHFKPTAREVESCVEDFRLRYLDDLGWSREDLAFTLRSDDNRMNTMVSSMAFSPSFRRFHEVQSLWEICPSSPVFHTAISEAQIKRQW